MVIQSASLPPKGGARVGGVSARAVSWNSCARLWAVACVRCTFVWPAGCCSSPHRRASLRHVFLLSNASMEELRPHIRACAHRVHKENVSRLSISYEIRLAFGVNGPDWLASASKRRTKPRSGIRRARKNHDARGRGPRVKMQMSDVTELA